MSTDKKQTDISQEGKEKFQHHLDKPYIRGDYKGTGKLQGKVAIITGGDSGIGRSVAVHYAREGAEVAIVYHKSDDDAEKTKALIKQEGKDCLLIKGDIADEAFCQQVVTDTVANFGKLDILVNNAGTHEEDKRLQDISAEQLRHTFEVNIFSFFYLTKAALAEMSSGSTIINTASVTAYRGSGHLLDYSSTKGAIVTFTRSLALNVAEKGIRVNGVAPGPIWTPLVVYSFNAEQLEKFGKDTPLGRAGYPQEVAPVYVYLASDDSTFVTGQMIHVNGGDVING